MKCIAKCKREQVADDLSDFLSHNHLFQCGGVKMRGTDVANLFVRSVFVTRKGRGVSGGGIYVDIVSAVYSIIREYLVPGASSDEAIAHLFATLGLDTLAIHQFAELLAAPTALASAGVPEIFRYSISHHFVGTFFLYGWYRGIRKCT